MKLVPVSEIPIGDVFLHVYVSRHGSGLWPWRRVDVPPNARQICWDGDKMAWGVPIGLPDWEESEAKADPQPFTQGQEGLT